MDVAEPEAIGQPRGLGDRPFRERTHPREQRRRHRGRHLRGALPGRLRPGDADQPRRRVVQRCLLGVPASPPGPPTRPTSSTCPAVLGSSPSPASRRTGRARFGRGFRVARRRAARRRVGLTVVHPGGVRTNIVVNATQATGMRHPAAAGPVLRPTDASPSVAPEECVAAIRNDQRRALVTGDAIVLDWLRRLAPVWGNRVVADTILKRLGVRDSSGEPTTRA